MQSNIFKSLLLLQFLSYSHKTCHVSSVCKYTKKLEQNNRTFITMWFCFHVQNFTEIGCWVIARKRFLKWRLSVILNFFKYSYLVIWLSSSSKCAVVYPISSKSDNFLLKYCNFAIFNMVAVCLIAIKLALSCYVPVCCVAPVAMVTVADTTITFW